jgi:SOS-response transcriptional repressor LexA
MTVLMRPGEKPNPGDICAVWVDGDGGTLKRVYPGDKTIQLMPENDEYDPMEVDTDRVRIQGVLVATVDISVAQKH